MHQVRGGSRVVASVPLVKNAMPIAPLSYQQETYWAAQQRQVIGYRTIADGRPVANTFGGFRVKGELDIAVLRRGLNEVLRRHESLRMRFQSIDGVTMQAISTADEVPLEYVDLRRLRPAQRDDAAANAAADAAMRAFDYSGGLLLRAHLIGLDEYDAIVVLVVPHIVSDSVSIQVLLDEVLTLYCHFLHGQPSPLPEPRVQYADFVLWQRTWVDGEVRRAVEEYVARRFIGANPLMLPSDGAVLSPEDADASEIAFRLDHSLVTAVYAMSMARRVTPFVILLSAFNAFLCRWSGRTDILLLAPFAGRPRNTERMVGMFSNHCPIRTDLSGKPRFADLVAQTEQNVMDALKYRCVPFAFLVNTMRGRGDIRCEGGVSVNAVPDGGRVLPRGCAELLDTRTEVSPYVVDTGRVAMRRMRGQLSCWLGFSESGAISVRLIHRLGVFSLQTMTRASQALVAEIEALTHNPDRRIFDVVTRLV
jgi:hypothetical protein